MKEFWNLRGSQAQTTVLYIMYFIILWVDIGVETVPDFVRSSFVDRAGNSGEEKSGTRCAGLSLDLDGRFSI